MLNKIEAAEVLRDLADIGEHVVSQARQVLDWLQAQQRESAGLRSFIGRPTVPAALGIAKEMEELDARLRHDAVRSPVHLLVGRLGAIKRLARDLRSLEPVNGLARRALDGHLDLLELPTLIEPASPRPDGVADLASLAHAGTGARVARALVVEDDDWWRERLAAKVRELFPLAECETFASYQAARDRFVSLSRQKNVLVVLDLGLPDSGSAGEMDDTSLGLELLKLARAYENLWRVVVVTRPRNFLRDQVVATRLGVQPEDYIFKIDEAWEADVESSLRRLNRTVVPRLEIVYEEGTSRGTVRAGDVGFTLDGRPFTVLRILAEAHEQKATEDQIYAALDEEGDVVERTGLSDTLLKIRRAFVEAFVSVGRQIQQEDIVRTRVLTSGEKPDYVLLPPATVHGLSESPRPPEMVADRVLVVEDDPVAAGEIAGWLRRMGASVLTCAARDEALREAVVFRPHIVCLDLALPAASGGAVDVDGGLTLLDDLRALPGLAAVRAVVVSAGAHHDEVRRQGLLRGIRVDDWLHKADQDLASWLVRSCARVRAEIEQGVAMSADERSATVLEVWRGERRAVLDGHSLDLSRSPGGFAFLEMLAERAWLPVSILTLEEGLGLGMNAQKVLRQRAKRLRAAAGEEPRTEDTFIKGLHGAYVLRASVIWRE